MFVFRVILVRIFPHLDLIRRDTEYLSVFSLNMGNADQSKSKYGHILRSELLRYFSKKAAFFDLIFFLNMLDFAFHFKFLYRSYFHQFNIVCIQLRMRKFSFLSDKFSCSENFLYLSMHMLKSNQ